MKDLSINALSTYECTGCSVCKVICPVDECIDINLDGDGYYIAISNSETCINCNLCQSVCYKFQDVFETDFNTNLETYIAYNKNDHVRYNSSSAGAASAIFKSALELGYTVIGAELDYNSMRLNHVEINSSEELYKIMGSKYIPSYAYNAFDAIKKNKKYVAIGTPCQIGGLRKYFNQKNNYEVILIDFRCFGHAGYGLFDKYQKYIETNINNSGVSSLNMRSKEKNWHMWGVTLNFKDGTKYYKDKFNDLFAIGFRTGQSIHDVCLNCDMYKNSTHADIRLEDAWAFVTQQKDDKLKNGLSQVGIFTTKGLEFFNKAKTNMVYEKVEYMYENASWTKIEKDDDFVLSLRKSDEKLESIIRRFWLKHPKKFIKWNIKYFWSSDLYKKIKKFIPIGLKPFLLRIIR